MTHLAYLFSCLSNKDDPLRSALDFVAQPTGPPLVHAAHYCRKTQWWRYGPWKLHLSGVVLLMGNFRIQGHRVTKRTCLQTTCENLEHVPVTATLRSHLNFFLPEDILRSFNFRTPRVSDGMHCMVGNNDVLQCNMCICKMLRFSEAGAAVVSNYLRYLSIFAYWFIFFSAWFWRHLIYIYCSTSYFGTFGRGRACPRTFFLSTLIAAPQRLKLEFIFRCPERAQALGTGRPPMRYHGEDSYYVRTQNLAWCTTCRLIR